MAPVQDRMTREGRDREPHRLAGGQIVAAQANLAPGVLAHQPERLDRPAVGHRVIVLERDILGKTDRTGCTDRTTPDGGGDRGHHDPIGPGGGWYCPGNWAGSRWWSRWPLSRPAAGTASAPQQPGQCPRPNPASTVAATTRGGRNLTRTHHMAPGYSLPVPNARCCRPRLRGALATMVEVPRESHLLGLGRGLQPAALQVPRRVPGYPQQDLNLRTRLRRPALYPLSYGG